MTAATDEAEEAGDGVRAADDEATSSSDSTAPAAVLSSAGGGDSGGPASSRRLLQVLVVVFALTAVVMTGLVVSIRSENRDLLEDVRAAQQGDPELRRLSGEFATALLTYDSAGDLDATLDAVLALSIGAFRDEYEDLFPGLSELITDTGAASSVIVKDIFLGEIEQRGATSVSSSLVVVDITTTGPSGTNTRNDTYLRLSMLKLAGEGWLVDGVTNLTVERGTGQIPLGGTTGPDDEDPGSVDTDGS